MKKILFFSFILLNTLNIYADLTEWGTLNQQLQTAPSEDAAKQMLFTAYQQYGQPNPGQTQTLMTLWHRKFNAANFPSYSLWLYIKQNPQKQPTVNNTTQSLSTISSFAKTSDAKTFISNLVQQVKDLSNLINQVLKTDLTNLLTTAERTTLESIASLN